MLRAIIDKCSGWTVAGLRRGECFRVGFVGFGCAFGDGPVLRVVRRSAVLREWCMDTCVFRESRRSRGEQQ